MRRVGLVVREAGQVNLCVTAEMLQHVPGPDLVAAVRRVGNTMGEEQELGLHPSPRAMSGPSRFAAQSGNFCQAAIFSRYFGSSGLIARGASPSAMRTA